MAGTVPQTVTFDSSVLKLTQVDTAQADVAARIRRETGLKLPDALIAACALQLGLPLATANAKDFRRVASLELIEC